MALGLSCFWSERELEDGIEWSPDLGKALEGSQQFVAYYSQQAKKSKWVEKECHTFYSSYHINEPQNRRMYLLMDKACNIGDIPPLLKGLQRPKSSEALLNALNKNVFTCLNTKIEQTKVKEEKLINNLKTKHENEILKLRNDLERERNKVEEARYYYRYDRFWSQIAENKDLHIFTCGRDVRNDPNSPRGYGGRTNIDVWDYRAVLDITHFFASRYPNIKITIEDPVSKLHDQDLKHATRLADRLTQMRSMLEDKDCIIVGSPDVSDFAEVVLAHIHHIDPYTDGREKKKGYVLVKERKRASSSFYWEKKEQEEEGVVQILDKERKDFPHKIAQEGGSAGKMYGILVVANNPFYKKEQRRKIVILSGFSGVATDAIAKLLTDETYLHEFYKLDKAYSDIKRDVEALVGVEYQIEKYFVDRDTRQITAITFEGLVQI